MSKVKNASKSLAIPETRGRKRKYNFHDMEVGERIAVDAKLTTVAHSARSWARSRGNGWKFAARVIDGIGYLYRSA